MYLIILGKLVYLRKIFDKIFIWIFVGYIMFFKCFIFLEFDKKMLWSVFYDRNKVVCYVMVRFIIVEELNCGKNVGVLWFGLVF